ncbi:E3 ubiquitin-protein ligase TRIM17 [Sorex fumeus]|uniref:E3 ubiquitin-protein ligase TRIM17 n=1 Tax=Sorex fumeus TaxID=62283 RepID=UPI0024AC872D|nr:E3 ubiquitin-protein ligase TRIM17 [Sorex fumeus]
MDAVELARKLQEEATCSICLDYFTDPVMTDCGHNFCRECIRLTWEKAKGKKGRKKHRGSFPCPECRELSPQRSLRPNRLLTKVAEMARLHPAHQRSELCPVHQELLKLFCQDDQGPICVVCRESREHRTHMVLPIEEVVQEYKQRLKEDREQLREEMAKTRELQAEKEQSLAAWQEQVEERRARITAEFQKVSVLLEDQRARLLRDLQQEQEETAARLQGATRALEQQGQALETRLLRLEDQEGRTPLQMLQDMKDPLDRKKSVSVQYPETAPATLRTPCRVPGQIDVLKRFQEDVLPDPASAYPHLLLYESRLRRYLSTAGGAAGGQDRFLAYPCAVGLEAFSSGRHYWEVGVSLAGEAPWALGVCRDDVSRRERVPKSPENGFWVVQLSRGPQPPPRAGPARAPVTLSEPPSQLGVFLDFEAGEVSFYSLRDGSHLHTYAQAAFPGPLRPFFCLGTPKSGQMVVSTVTLWLKG